MLSAQIMQKISVGLEVLQSSSEHCSVLIRTPQTDTNTAMLLTRSDVLLVLLLAKKVQRWTGTSY